MIAAEGEQKASRALREAAEVIAESPSALQVTVVVVVVVYKLFVLLSIQSFLWNAIEQEVNADVL